MAAGRLGRDARCRQRGSSEAELTEASRGGSVSAFIGQSLHNRRGDLKGGVAIRSEILINNPSCRFALSSLRVTCTHFSLSSCDWIQPSAWKLELAPPTSSVWFLTLGHAGGLPEEGSPGEPARGTAAQRARGPGLGGTPRQVAAQPPAGAKLCRGAGFLVRWPRTAPSSLTKAQPLAFT